VNGQSREFNQLMIEGVNDDERTGLLQIYIPPAEAIQTVDVSTSNYTAEFGRAAGAVTNVILKSGTKPLPRLGLRVQPCERAGCAQLFQPSPQPGWHVAPTTTMAGVWAGQLLRTRRFLLRRHSSH